MEYRKFFLSALYALAAIACVWLFAAVVLPLGLPFFLALLLAVLAEPAVKYLIERQNFPRWAAAALCVAGIYILLGLGLFFLCRCGCRELGGFLRQLPALLQELTPTLQSAEQRLAATAAKLPDGLGTGLSNSINTFFEGGFGLLQDLPEKAVGFLTDAAQAIPSFLLFAVTTMAASFMVAAQLPALRRWPSRVLPKKWRRWVTVTWQKIRSVGGSWLLAQGKLMAVTFGVLTLGFLLLRVDYPLLLGLLVAIVDALPVLGTGTVLIPWALILFLQGQTARGIAFLVLYGTAALTRTALEPRFIGKQMGLNPLVTLAALYVGFRLAGLMGMILFPMGAAIAVQLKKISALGKISS